MKRLSRGALALAILTIAAVSPAWAITGTVDIYVPGTNPSGDYQDPLGGWHVCPPGDPTSCLQQAADYLATEVLSGSGTIGTTTVTLSSGAAQVGQCLVVEDAGGYVPAGTTVTAVAGSAVTLSQPIAGANIVTTQRLLFSGCASSMVIHGGPPNVGYGVSQEVDFPPLEYASVKVEGGATIGGPVSGGGAVFKFDSCEGCRIDLRAAQLNNTSGPGCAFVPRNPLPIDRAVQINDSTIELGTCATNGNFGVYVDLLQPGSSGMFDVQRFTINEAMGNYGVYITSTGSTGPSTSSVFQDVHIDAPHVHSQTGLGITGFQLGDRPTPSNFGRGVTLNLGVSTQTAASRCVDIFASGIPLMLLTCDGPVGSAGGQDGIFEVSAGASWTNFIESQPHGTFQGEGVNGNNRLAP